MGKQIIYNKDVLLRFDEILKMIKNLEFNINTYYF